MKVFVTGATGFVGGEILRQLHASGHAVRILVRSPNNESSQRIISQYKAEMHCGNVLDKNSLKESLNGIDAVIHLVGIISEVGENTFENIHIRGTENMVNAARASGVKRFLQMSALGARLNAVSRYHQSKWAAEEFLRTRHLDYTIFRPSIIYGRGDQFVNLFAKMSRYSPFLPVMGEGTGTMQPIPVAEVAKCFVNSLSEERSVKQTYDLCGPEILTLPEILKIICEVTGRKRFFLRIPMSMARAIATMIEFIFPLFGKAPPFTRDQLIMLSEKIAGDGEPANQLFNLSSPSFREGITAYLQ